MYIYFSLNVKGYEVIMGYLQRSALILFVFSIFAGYQIIPGSSVATGEFIGDSKVVDVGEEAIVVTRCYDFVRINLFDGGFYDISMESAEDFKVISTGDSVFAFTFIDADRDLFNIEARRIYPSPGLPRIVQINYPLLEWFPIYDGTDILLLVTSGSDEGHPDSSFFREGRDYHFLTYPDLLEVHLLTDMPRPTDVFKMGDEIAISGQRGHIESDSLPEYFLELNMTRYSMTHIPLESLEPLSTIHLGNKGYREEHLYAGGINSRYEGITVGRSDRDIDGDGHLDIPTINSVFGDTTGYSVCIDGDILFTSDTAVFYDFLFLSDFLPGEGGDLLLGSEYLSELEERGELSGWSASMVEIKDFHDIDGDGFSELFGWWADTVKYFDIDPDIVAWNFARGWNVISLPYADIDSTVDSYPFIIPPVFAFDPEGGAYEPTDTLMTGIGYFALCDRDTTLYPEGDSITFFNFEYQRGWNIAGTTSRWLSAREIGEIPIIYLGPFSFDTETRNYTDKEAIMPGTGFLFLSTESGSVRIEVD